jgi:hypothetical protein
MIDSEAYHKSMYVYLMPLSVSSLRKSASLLFGGAAYGMKVPEGGFGNPNPFIAAVRAKHIGYKTVQWFIINQYCAM